MKTLSSTMTLSLTTLLVIALISCSSCKKDPIPTPTPTTYTISFNANGGSGSVFGQTVNSGTSISLPSASGFSYAGYTFTSWNTAANGSGTTYNAGSSYAVTGNVTLYAQWQLNAPVYTAVFTATDASSTATLKSLPGNSVVKALVLNVTTAGSVKLETIGALTNSNPAIGYYWITSKDSLDINQATSTLSPVLAKTVITASQTINLSVGVNVICFKTAALNGAITNGASIGLKVTGASTTIANASYTADATSANSTNVVKVYLKQVGGAKASINLQATGLAVGDMQVIPYNDEAGTVYDGNLYPSINFLSFDTKNTAWISPTTGYSGLDFTNTIGSAGRNLQISQIDGTVTPAVQRDIFVNSQAVLSSGVVTFSSITAIQMVKSNLGNFAYASLYANVYNPTSTQFGPASVCWYLKSVRFAGNPELWIYDPSGARIW